MSTHEAGSDAEADANAVAAQLLDVKSQKLRSPLDPHLPPAADSTTIKKRRTTTTTTTTTTFPLTPTSAIGEAERELEQSIASSKPEVSPNPANTNSDTAIPVLDHHQ